MTYPRPYEEGFASIRRVVSHAIGAKKLNAFRIIASEVPKWIEDGGVAKNDAVDDLAKILLANGIPDDEAAGAIAGIFADAEVKTNRKGDIETHGFDGVKRTANGSAKPESAALVIRSAAEIVPQEIVWLWPHRIAIGKLVIVAGEPGLGKSQLTCWIGGAISTGGNWPSDEGRALLGSVIILSAEDDAADTIRPRLDACGADAGRVYVVSAVKAENDKGRRAFNLQADLALLEKEIGRIGDVRLVVIDPVSSYLGKVDSHKNAELRAVLEPVAEMAARLRVAIVVITHLNKSSGGSANNRFIGSIAFVAAARAAYIVARDPDDHERRLFLPTKNNLGPEGTGLGFRVGAVETPSGIIAPTIFWDESPVTVTANEALSASSENGSATALNGAEEFLRQVLADGPIPTRQVQSEAKAAGLAWATVRRAKDALGATAAKTALDGGWVWALPEDAHR